MRFLLLFLILCAPALAQDLPRLRAQPPEPEPVNFYVNTASTAGGDGTTNNTSGATRAFASLREALTNSGLDIDEPRRINCSGTAADTLNCVQATWNSISTTPEDYIEIIGDNTTGKYNTSAYRMEVTDENAIYNNQPGHVRLKNIQVFVQTTTSSGSPARSGIRLSTLNVGVGRTDCDCRAINCIVKLSQAGSDDAVGFFDSPFAETNGGTMKRINCIAYSVLNNVAGYTTGYDAAWSGVQNYNCTSYGCDQGFLDPQVTINCLAANSIDTWDFLAVGTGSGTSNYNASTDATAVGANSRQSQTFTFVNAGAGDFGLQAGDTGAKGYGTTSPAGGYNYNITGAARSAPWNIGAW